MSDDFETQWEMAARTKNWKCPSCGAVQRKTEQMKRLTVAKERNEQLIVNLDMAACPKCNKPIDLLDLAGGKYDIKSTGEKRDEAQVYGCLIGVIGGIIAGVVVYQFYDWPFPIIAVGFVFGILFGLTYSRFKPRN